ncbi:DUF6081 family protein [Kitasatospora purpeofusca]|uniref:DUF6081 family protein n=1 Tax=Kitasatospora purpeofusca TaxID=67352 RepID=UPI0036D30078
MLHRTRLLLLSLIAALCAALLSAPAAAATDTGSRHYRLVWDDFRRGFRDSGPNARWVYAGYGPFTPDDAVASTSPRGLRLVPKGVNSRTGEPAFSQTVPQDYPMGGELDHAKWVTLTSHQASTGYAGFDAVPGYELSCETWLTARTYGTAGHPFGPSVPADDLRLAAAAVNAVDAETGLIFDFFVTGDKVYAFYERSPYYHDTLGDYASFAFAIPVADRNPATKNHLRIGYDRAAGVVRWYVDGKKVYEVGRLGHHVSRAHMVLDHGGTQKDVRPRQLNCGMGLFSVLDGSAPGRPGSGLVRLTDAKPFYFDPATGAPAEQRFQDDASLPGSRLFGQGAELAMDRYVISSRPVGRD